MAVGSESVLLLDLDASRTGFDTRWLQRDSHHESTRFFSHGRSKTMITHDLFRFDRGDSPGTDSYQDFAHRDDTQSNQLRLIRLTRPIHPSQPWLGMPRVWLTKTSKHYGT